MKASIAAVAVCAVTIAGCDYATRIHAAKNAPVDQPTSKPSATAVASAPPADPLGKPPIVGPAKAFPVPKPVEFVTENGIHVLLVERPELPIVSATFVVPVGVSSDPANEPGLANITVDMMDEGAGKRGAVELSTAIGDIGASLSLSAGLDASYASVSSLKGHFGEAFGILSDVVARPHFDPVEWKRVSSLWKNSLKKRADDPGSVASLVASAAIYGRDTPYGHPSLGLLTKADAVTLTEAKRFYQGSFRPDRATLVIAGQITQREVEELLKSNLADWKTKGDAITPPLPTPPIAANARPKLIVVDRPSSVQAVIVVSRDGVRVDDKARPDLDLINTALGGSFTSRLNENLREKNGWTYGAGSSFSNARGQGTFTVHTAVETEFTAPAAREIRKELDGMATGGLTADELKKVKAQDSTDLVEIYETVGGTTSRMASHVALGLPTNEDAIASAERQRATLDDLFPIAKAHVDPSACTFVIVGDAKTIIPALASEGFDKPTLYTAEGVPQ